VREVLQEHTFAPHTAPTTCDLDVCDCHIGYVHLPHLDLRSQFAHDDLARIPADPAALAPW
jgi:hypothetical protein